MADKTLERAYFRRFQAAVPRVAGLVPSEPEPPDFLVETPEGRVGIELTAFYVPPAPGQRPSQEMDALRDRVVQRAERLHAAAGGPALYVSVFFGRDRALRKSDVVPMASALAESLLRRKMPASIHEPGVELGFGDLPEGIAHVHVSGSVNGIDKLWQASGGGWVVQISPDMVQAEIGRKSRSLELGRRQSDELWLVIVHDLAAGGDPFELAPDAAAARYVGDFDKLYWFDPHGPLALELPKA